MFNPSTEILEDQKVKFKNITHKAPKSNVNRLFTSFYPFHKRTWRLIIWSKVKKTKSNYINFRPPIWNNEKRLSSRVRVGSPSITCSNWNPKEQEMIVSRICKQLVMWKGGKKNWMSNSQITTQANHSTQKLEWMGYGKVNLTSIL